MKDLPNEPCGHFGGCPECGSQGAYLNIGRDHWVYCETHKVKWNVGSNLFSSWRHESESDWQANRMILANFRGVSPRYRRLAIDEKRLLRESVAMRRLQRGNNND